MVDDFKFLDEDDFLTMYRTGYMEGLAESLRIGKITPKEFNRLRDEFFAKGRRQKDKLEKELAPTLGKRDALNRLIEWTERAKKDQRLERPLTSVFHQLEQAMADGMVCNSRGAVLPKITPTNIFLIEHDWSMVLGHSDETAGDVRLPFERCAFELQISGMRIVLCCVEGDDFVPDIFYRCGDWWVHDAYGEGPRGRLRDLIRSSCIMLEAEVAETEVTRAPEKLNKQRAEKGRTPLRDFHTIRLSHRHHVRRREEAEATEDYTRKRLHFRRGHWRHYQGYKTWIKWTMVGDPDLGFVDKEYRL